MPQPDTTGAELAGDQTANREGTDVTTTELGTEQIQSDQPMSGISQGILDRLGVPEELARQIGLGKEAEQPPRVPEQSSDNQSPEAAAVPEAEPTEPETEPEGRTDEQPNKAWAPEVQAEFNKRIGKLTKQRSDERTRAEEAEAQRDELRQQLEATQPVMIMPTENDPLGWIETPAQLAQLEREADMTIDWCDANRDGATVTQKDGTEEEFTPERVEQMKTKANRYLRLAPRRKEWIGQRAEADAVARANFPRLFEKGTTEYQVAQAVLKEFPSVATHPARNLVLGDYLVGLAVRLQNEENARNNGNGAGAPKTVQKTADSPNPLTRKIPPVAQHVPRSSGAPVQNTGKKVDEAMNNVYASGGDRSSIAAAFRAMKNAEKTSPNRRAPAPV